MISLKDYTYYVSDDDFFIHLNSNDKNAVKLSEKDSIRTHWRTYLPMEINFRTESWEIALVQLMLKNIQKDNLKLKILDNSNYQVEKEVRLPEGDYPSNLDVLREVFQICEKESTDLEPNFEKDEIYIVGYHPNSKSTYYLMDLSGYEEPVVGLKDWWVGLRSFWLKTFNHLPYYSIDHANADIDQLAVDNNLRSTIFHLENITDNPGLYAYDNDPIFRFGHYKDYNGKKVYNLFFVSKRLGVKLRVNSEEGDFLNNTVEGEPYRVAEIIRQSDKRAFFKVYLPVTTRFKVEPDANKQAEKSSKLLTITNYGDKVNVQTSKLLCVEPENGQTLYIPRNLTTSKRKFFADMSVKPKGIADGVKTLAVRLPNLPLKTNVVSSFGQEEGLIDTCIPLVKDKQVMFYQTPQSRNYHEIEPVVINYLDVALEEPLTRKKPEFWQGFTEIALHCRQIHFNTSK